MKHCCEVFPKIQDQFIWFSVALNRNTRCMPCLHEVDADYRVNFCPSCGANVRSIEINEDGERTA